jgi:non-ribosomal peptide synthetase component F
VRAVVEVADAGSLDAAPPLDELALLTPLPPLPTEAPIALCLPRLLFAAAAAAPARAAP